MSKIKRLIVIVISLTLLSTSVFAGNAAIHLDKAVSPKGGEIITLPVTLFQQETGYYCGPASVQMVVNYLSDYVEQDDLASDLGCFGGGGTNVDKVLPCLNKYLGSGYYEECRTYGGDNIAGLIPLSINNGNPVICNVETRYICGHNLTTHIYGRNFRSHLHKKMQKRPLLRSRLSLASRYPQGRYGGLQR